MPSTAEPIMAERPAPRRLRRAWLAGLIGIVIVACLIGAFFLGVQHTPKGPSVQEQAAATVPVFSPVQRRVVSDGVQVAGTVKPGATATLTWTDGGILVRRTLQVGQSLDPGVLLGVVDGNPRFGLDGPLPLYRDLCKDDRGDDVAALQQALAGAGYTPDRDGHIGRATLDAVTALYRSEDLDTPKDGIETIQRSVFIPLPGGERRVVSAAEVGQSIGPDHPLATVRTAAATVEFHVGVDDAGKAKEGTALTVTTSQGRTAGKVSSVGQFQAGENGQEPGYILTATVDDPAVLQEGQSVSISTDAGQETVLAVPLTAIRQDGQGTYVQVRSTDQQDRNATRRVGVTLLRSADGYEAVDGELGDADQVLVQ